jgi:NitT/TauT family transport system permease protein
MTTALTASFTPNGHVTARVYTALTLGTVGAILLAWVFRPAFLPSPVEVVQAYPPLVQDGLFAHLYVSLLTNGEAILLSCLFMIPIAYLTLLPAVRPFAKILAKIRFLGLTGLAVAFEVFFGGGHALKVAILVFGMSVFLMTSLYDLIETIPKEDFDYARSLRLGPWASLYEVVIRGRLDAVIDAIRQNAAMGWVLLTMVEGLVRFEGGLGVMMLNADKLLRLDSVFAVQFIVLAIGITQDYGFVVLRRLVCPYVALKLERS